MGTETNKDDRNNPEYLAQLLKDKKQIQALPNIFVHVEKLLDEEINRVRIALFHNPGLELKLPEPQGPPVTLSEKIYVPVKDHPEFNFVGRILGPRGMTAKELETQTGCKIMVRGKGSMRDKVKVSRFCVKEEQNRGKANWEHLNEDLHVLITVEDSRNRAEAKLAKAVQEVKKLLVPAPDGEDELKKRQLMELAILNGTYRDAKTIPAVHHIHAQRFLAQPLQLPMRTATPSPAGAPIILAPRLPHGLMSTTQSIMNSAPPPLVSPTGESGLMYNPYEHPYPYGLAAPTILEYPAHIDPTAGVFQNQLPQNSLSFSGLNTFYSGILPVFKEKPLFQSAYHMHILIFVGFFS
ncbi:protein quaking-B-like isoform X3 [Pomacea canaliculata]|uniref:protein quaking-B-like isoform X3 n=1 Tax=Pomacea canaliculata TaxID=400727 RepID=UPI000D729C48|nr:protein quaking-B-like isoform X3 [Pomacea canaliculata]